METLTINYLSHQRNKRKYWKITSHFLNKLIKNKVKINLLLTEDKNFESH